MGRVRDWRWRRRVRRVMRRDCAWISGGRVHRAAESFPDPALLHRAGEITDLRERRLAYEAAAHSRPAAGSRGSRRFAILLIACAATATFVLTVLAAIVGNPWVAATVAALVAGVCAGLAGQRPITRSFDHGPRARRQFRAVHEPLDD
jgi:IS5 family transposase